MGATVRKAAWSSSRPPRFPKANLNVYILGSGEGESVRIGGSVCTFKATGKDTRGHAGLFEFTMPPGAGASPHIHKELTEMFYVTEGKVELLLADKKVNASQGAFMLVPESTPHGFTNIGNSQATLLICFVQQIHVRAILKGWRN